MKPSIGAVLIVLIFLGGCSTLPKKPSLDEAFYINKNLEDAHVASVDALVVNGFNIKKNTPNYIQGQRPNKIGLVVGSGGEVVGIWLEPVDESKTRVLVKNQKTFAGYLGQKNWESEVRKEILGVGEWK